MTILGWGLAALSLVTALWWILARSRAARGLEIASGSAALGSILLLAVEGIFWQNLPWQGLGLLVGVAAALRRWRPRPISAAARVLATLLVVFTILTGALFALFVPVPTLAAPRGEFAVGSEIFRWTDPTRIETFTPDPADLREVVVQVWYPADVASARRVPYFEAQGRLPGSVLGLPAWYYRDFDRVDVHASETPVISSAQATHPVVVFDPGLNNARESYTALVTDLASHGIVVVALTHPHEASVAVLSDGRVVGRTISLFDGPATSTQILDTREADIRFVADKLEKLAAEAPSSPLAEHLDMRRLALVGHSLGGATATQVLANDSRFLAGVNLDGTLFHQQPTLELRQPFLWVRSGTQQMDSYERAQRDLFSNLQGGGVVLRIAGSAHNDLTDVDAYIAPWGRAILRPITTTGELAHDDMVAIASDAIRSFLAGPLRLPRTIPLDELPAVHPAVVIEKTVAPAAT